MQKIRGVTIDKEYYCVLYKLSVKEVAKYAIGETEYRYLIRIFYKEVDRVVMEFPTEEKTFFYHLYDIKKALDAFGELPK